MSAEKSQRPNQQALDLFEKGNLSEALYLYTQICDADKANSGAWLKRGEINVMLNQPGAAIDCFRHAITLLPHSIETRLKLANVLLQDSKWAQAKEESTRVVQTAPRSALGWFMLGWACSELDQLDEAAAAYKKSLDINADFANASHGLGSTLLRMGQWTEAIPHFRHALQMNPQIAQAHWGLANSLQMQGNLQEALTHYQEAVKIKPTHVDAHLGIGLVLALMGEQYTAVEYIRKAINLNPDNINAQITLAATLMPLGQPDEAESVIDTVLAKEPDNIEAISLATNIDQHKGNLDKALKRLKPLINAGTNEVNVALAYAAICSSMDEHKKAIPILEQLLENGQPVSITGQRNLHFNLGKLYDAEKKYSEAFKHYQQGNKLKQANFDPHARDNETDIMIATFSQDRIAEIPQSSIHSEQPVFVVGMPRSGTSLIEQILASHPAIFGAGELNHIIQIARSMHTTLNKTQPYPQCLQELDQIEMDNIAKYYLDQTTQLAPGLLRVIDKMPGNFMHLGLIERLFPGARIIHSMRNPMDTCLSCYFQDFSRSHPYSYNLTHLGAFYNSYEKTMQHWRNTLHIPMLEVQYEDLITDQETASRQMVEFCGLEWDDRCQDFHKTKRYVATASYDQVRRPIYTSSVSRWKNYAEFLSPLIEALD